MKTPVALLAAAVLALCAGAARAEKNPAAEKVVSAFVASWAKAPVDETMGFLSDDIEYENMPTPGPIQGKAKTREFLEPFFKKDPLLVPFAIHVKIHHMVSDGGVVMLDRTDSFTIAGKTYDLPVAAIFEVKDGKITVWRDYFDMKSFEAPAALIETLMKQ